MYIKLILLVSLGLIATGLAYPKTACGSGPTHHLILGNRQYGDRMLYTAREKMPSAMLRVKTLDVQWPLKGMQSHERITRIEVLDQKDKGTGGCAFLANGGVGDNHVKLHLKTQRGGSFDFVVNIYGR
uniref:Heteropteran venom family 3 protein 1 n=1 Tax=Ectomocoris sp. TaxID=3104572 RepID=A0AB38ZEA3_9HEMI